MLINVLKGIQVFYGYVIILVASTKLPTFITEVFCHGCSAHAFSLHVTIDVVTEYPRCLLLLHS